jgi:hypothetical protein
MVGENYEDAETGLDPFAELTGHLEPGGTEEPGKRAITPR